MIKIYSPETKNKFCLVPQSSLSCCSCFVVGHFQRRRPRRGGGGSGFCLLHMPFEFRANDVRWRGFNHTLCSEFIILLLPFARVSPPPLAITHCTLLARSSPSGPRTHSRTYTLQGDRVMSVGKQAGKRDTRDPLTFLLLGTALLVHVVRFGLSVHCCLAGCGEGAGEHGVDDGGARAMLC